MRKGLLFTAIALLNVGPVDAFADDKRATVASGKTQVVARAGNKEVTLSELRLEMARLGLAANNPQAEQVALESLINRTLLAAAARDVKFHRKPEMMARMYAAQDQALAEAYLATAAQPPEPTRGEIEEYIADHTELFAQRRVYDFDVLSMDSSLFDEEALTPLFDEEPDFSRLEAILTQAGARYEVARLTQGSAAFPAPIRRQLGKYTVNDNIVIAGSGRTQIMKIISVRLDDVDASEFGAQARRYILNEQAQKRAADYIERLKKEAGVRYFRPSATPTASAVPETSPSSGG
ncbi:MAG: hypothetical protein AAFY84_01250 [Pseudomonadota bacterium]